MTPVRSDHRRILVIGGGNGGLSVAGRLRIAGVDGIAVIDPNETHLYKPLFSHVAGGTARASETARPQASVIPKGVEWIKDAAVAVDPDADAVDLAGGGRLTYDHLIVCPGIQKDWDAVPGLPEAMKTAKVSSHYEYEGAEKTSHLLRDLTRGTAVFTQPAGPATCAGAAQKPMYQACDYWRATGVLDDIRVVLVVPGPTPSDLSHIDRELERKIAEYGIEVRAHSEVHDVSAGEVTVKGPEGTERIAFDVLNVVPPQSAPDWLKRSALARPGDARGFVDVDAETLRHRRYANVWALGDAAATRNAKSGGALRKQTLVLAENLVAVLAGEEPTAAYDQYTVCPYTVSRSTVVFAEFDDHNRPRPTIPFWKGMYREARLSWIFDRHILPWIYWHGILQGRV